VGSRVATEEASDSAREGSHASNFPNACLAQTQAHPGMSALTTYSLSRCGQAGWGEAAGGTGR
jgi:hypothetical protein